MFDFDDIEDNVQKGGAMQASEHKPSNTGGGGGMFDFDEIENDAKQCGKMGSTASTVAAHKAQVEVKVKFCYQQQRWTRNFAMDERSKIIDLKHKICKRNLDRISWMCLTHCGVSLENKMEITKGMCLSLNIAPPLGSMSLEDVAQQHSSTQLPCMSGRDMEVTIVCLAALGITTSFTVKEGATVRDLKERLSMQDPSGNTQVSEIRLAVAGSPWLLRDSDSLTEQQHLLDLR